MTLHITFRAAVPCILISVTSIMFKYIFGQMVYFYNSAGAAIFGELFYLCFTIVVLYLSGYIFLAYIRKNELLDFLLLAGLTITIMLLLTSTWASMYLFGSLIHESRLPPISLLGFTMMVDLTGLVYFLLIAWLAEKKGFHNDDTEN